MTEPTTEAAAPQDFGEQRWGDGDPCKRAVNAALDKVAAAAHDAPSWAVPIVDGSTRWAVERDAVLAAIEAARPKP